MDAATEPAPRNDARPARIAAPARAPLAPGRVTVKDVARVAGVSHGTVSKALNDAPGVGDPTRARIVQIANRLGYRPNNIARSLKVRQTHTLGVITNDSDGVFTTAMVRGVAEVASEHNFGVFVCNSYDRVAKERQHLELLLDKQVDGIILTGYKVAERGGPAAPTGQTPVVYLYEYTTAMDSPCIIPDDQAGARLATEHLLKLGRRRIGFINGPSNFEVTKDRAAGYRQALSNAGAAVRKELQRSAGDWNQDSGYVLAQELMTVSDRPDGLVCANDDLAAGAILGLRDLGRHVPDDIAVVGFDDRPFAAHLPVPLTTIALPLYEMGVLAAQRLFDALADNPMTNEIVRVPCRLVIRSSCGAQSADAAMP